MKKSLVLVLVFSLLLSIFCVSASAIAFQDLDESHWAYANVQKLVESGTVSGYEDGTFRPNGKVTRAEFVKMLGKSNVTRSKNYNDVSTQHWAYSYIMSANFPENETNMFLPDIPITRGIVAELLWIRGGKVETAYAPSIITSQYKKQPSAVAWVYATGLMKGDDGVSLRLDDTLTRAEAATLIIRAQGSKEMNVTFASAISPKILENVYNGLNLFDGKAYTPDATITNGEMARASIRIGTESTNLTYVGLNATKAFEHPYALDISVVAEKCLGSDKNNAAFADKKATFGDTVASLVYQFIRKSKSGQTYGAKTESLSANYSEMANICLTFAKNNGIISLKENLNEPITMKDFTILCLLLDNAIGSQTDIESDLHSITGTYIKKDHSLLLTEVPYDDFRVMLADMPYELYNKPFKNAISAPKNSYDFAREYNSIFTGLLQSLKEAVKSWGAEVRFTYYPSLVCDNGNGYSLRLACEILKVEGEKPLRDLFPIDDHLENADVLLNNGSVIYFDLATGGTFKSINATAENAYIEQILLVK